MGKVLNTRKGPVSGYKWILPEILLLLKTISPEFLFFKLIDMSKQGKNKDQMGVEMFRLLKIFGIASLCLVFFLSFFNEKKANNSGAEKTFSITDASRIYFNNIRRAYYNREANNEAKMDVFRLDIGEEEVSQDRIDLDLILNIVWDNPAFLFYFSFFVLK